jgi:hypothetical protein
LLRLTADRVGLTAALSGMLARPDFWLVHDRGRVLTDLAVMIADGGTTISQIDTLRHQGELFGSVASDTTVWRAWEDSLRPGWRRSRRSGRRSVSTCGNRSWPGTGGSHPLGSSGGTWVKSR